MDVIELTAVGTKTQSIVWVPLLPSGPGGVNHQYNCLGPDYRGGY
jgi:hypothetical protein